MDIRYHVIPHAQHRYPTVGDWLFREDGSLDLYSSDMGDWRYEYLVMYHEQTEAMWCKFHGVAEEDVAAFDIAYEECQRLGLPAPCGCPSDLEDGPGADPHAPYHEGHMLANFCEHVVAASIGVNLDEYDRAVEALFEE